ncbi:hypothetical protein BG005_011351, partial [Podila minutissima]
VAFALSIEPRIYYIESDDARLLGAGPFPRTFPPIDVPVGLFYRNSPFVRKWEVKSAEDGSLLISTRTEFSRFDYNIINKDGKVYVSTEKTPQTWSVSPVGDDMFNIKLPYEDKVLTWNGGEFDAVITFEAAEGLPNQKWYFFRYDRYDNYHHGSINRFCRQ